MLFLLEVNAEIEKAKAPRPRWPAGLSQGYGVFNYRLVCPTLKLITPSKALVVVQLIHRVDRPNAQQILTRGSAEICIALAIPVRS